MELYIKSWASWTPNHDSASTAVVLPTLPQVPANTRRRLSSMTRIAFDVALSATQNQADIITPSIFASRHGDLHKTVQLLHQLAARQPLSPTQFALSVHNAISGQFSIFSRNTADSTSIAAGADSLCYAMLEAATRFACEPDLKQLLVVYCDEPVPDIYGQFCSDPAKPIAIAFLLHRDQGQQIEFSLQPKQHSYAEPDQALKLLAFLQSDTATLRLAGNSQQWQWQRANPCGS
jgi:hypothetical protein